MLGIFLDLETNGLDFSKHRILEIAFKVMDLNQEKTLCAYSQKIFHSPHIWEQSDPQSLLINGFSPSSSDKGVSEKEVAEMICSEFKKLGLVRGKAVFICQNPSFDRLFFSQLIDIKTQEEHQFPYHWLDLASMFWAAVASGNDLNLPQFSETTILSKDYIAEFYGIDPEERPHRAMNGVNHLIQCYQAVIKPRTATKS